ncbi:fungal specific transcription factor [Colletotrichum sojae]|uniref:Fungal specific transcription factor n=1 Tax=Colletotrichum sojae TaxID=2175907 RepID=A0A8H6MLA0_9PEZI|nr:fungal specific transcription factor [Colletotrichum sojae]
MLAGDARHTVKLDLQQHAQLRIESILSPENADDARAASSTQSTPKRRFQETFSPTERSSVPQAAAEPPERQAVAGSRSSLSSAALDDDEPRPLVVGGTGGKRPSRAMRPPMRSSIACLRCRRSKIKCDNDNSGAPCDTCIKAGHKCEFPDPTPAPAKRAEPLSLPKQERDAGHDRKRVKKLEDAFQTDGTSKAYEVLSMPYLTGDIWHQLFDTYKLHFATELPFLHLPTLKGIIHDKDVKKPSADVNLVLLGVLALTARFQPDLVKYVAHQTYDKVAGPKSRGALPRADPSAASDYFASALTAALGPLESALLTASVVRVQAFLMLGLYKWSQPNGGLAAWMYVGVAIRMAQGLKLGFGDKLRRGKRASVPSRWNKPGRLLTESWKDREIRRRTMFSCLILDRLLSCGSERVSMVRSDDLQIQLPCTEHAFDLGRAVYTGFLRQTGEESDQAVDDSVLSRFVQLADFWGDITKYSFAGGRHTEDYPPWDEKSTFWRLNAQVDAFYANLPEEFTWSSSNFWKHDNSMYVSLHMLGALCRIMLHREYIPFIAIKCQKPVGPLDDPVFDPATVPNNFWHQSAEQVFKAGREIVDLIRTCRDKLPHSSLVIFAIWQAAFVGLYARHYSHMDTENHMVSEDEMQDRTVGLVPDLVQTSNTGIAFQALNRVAPFFSMASNYVTYFKDMDQYFTKVFSDFTQRSGRRSDGSLSIRLSSMGGLEEWRAKADKITSNGIIMDEERSLAFDGSDGSRASTLERSSSMGPEYSHLGGGGLDSRRGSRHALPSFTAINSAQSYTQGGHEGFPGSVMPQHSPTQQFAAASQPPSGDASQVPAAGGADVPIDSYVTQNQGKRLAELEDLQEFQGQFVCEDWEVYKSPTFYTQVASGGLPQLSENYT